jgi:2-methylcitrate dehydratase PrpD
LSENKEKDYQEIETENEYLKKEITRLQEMFMEEKDMPKVDVLTFKHKTQVVCDKCAHMEGSPMQNRNDFDDELEKGLQARVLFQKEEWREEVKKEMYDQESKLKNVNELLN